MSKSIENKFFFVTILIFVIGGVGVFSSLKYYDGTRAILIIKSDYESNAENTEAQNEVVNIYPPNTLNGIGCENYNRRPYAIMLAEDHEARPLSGIGLADLVIEMPVVSGSITRMMAVFVCGDPSELGSVRSARYDFIFLAKGYDAILAHWGGEKLALEELDGGIIDNLDALPNYFNTFFRKKWISAPHNGFTSMANMSSSAEKLGYRDVSKFEGYKFIENPKSEILNLKQIPAFTNALVDRQNSKSKIQKLSIGYAYPYNVRYEYDSRTNSYLRWRAGLKEIDRLTGEQVEAKNIVVMRAHSRKISKDYNDVDVIGRGDAVTYRNGEEVRGTWRKRSDVDILRFFDESGEEIKFVPGSIWIEIVELNTVVNYK